MAYWLCDTRRQQKSSPVMRFDPRFWTVNFPRPMMASVVTTGPESLRVDAVFYGSNDLAGLIWESEDRWDHPLLAYETRRDYSRLTLSFRWRSGGVLPLDAVNGPTLTIEGRTVVVPPGTNLIEAAKTAGVLIPHYCYHPGLPVAGVCRMCLVEMEKSPKPVASCAMP